MDHEQVGGLTFNRVNAAATVKRLTPADVRAYLYLLVCIGTMQLTTNYASGAMPVGYALSLFQLSTIVSLLPGHRILRKKYIPKKLIGSVIVLVGSVVISKLTEP